MDKIAAYKEYIYKKADFNFYDNYYDPYQFPMSMPMMPFTNPVDFVKAMVTNKIMSRTPLLGNRFRNNRTYDEYGRDIFDKVLDESSDRRYERF